VDKKPDEILTWFAAGSVVALLLSWMSYIWERSMGVTFVLSKGSPRRLGVNSTTDHLATTLHFALFITVVCGPLLWFSIRELRKTKSLRRKP
jgi:hypothetical protein